MGKRDAVRFNIVTFVAFCLMSTCAFSQVKSGSKVADKAVVSAAVSLKQRDASSLALDVKVRNEGPGPVYVALDPTQSDGTKGYYLSLADDQSLVIESRLYGPSDTTIIEFDKSSVQLKWLAPNEEYAFTILLKAPLRSSFLDLKPGPLKPEDADPKPIELSRIRNVQVNIGYFDEVEDFADLLKRRGSNIVSAFMVPSIESPGQRPFYRYQKLVSAVLQTRDIEDGWDGIRVLSSTRADVERKFGKPANEEYGVHYRTGNAWMNVIYSGEPCSGVRTNGELSVPKDTVLSFTVVPTTRLRLDDLDWKKDRFTRYPEVHRVRATNYISLDRATAITTIKDSDGTEIVESIDYQVTKETGAKWKCEKPAVR